jgi:hypothetical protein
MGLLNGLNQLLNTSKTSNSGGFLFLVNTLQQAANYQILGGVVHIKEDW